MIEIESLAIIGGNELGALTVLVEIKTSIVIGGTIKFLLLGSRGRPGQTFLFPRMFLFQALIGGYGLAHRKSKIITEGERKGKIPDSTPQLMIARTNYLQRLGGWPVSV